MNLGIHRNFTINERWKAVFRWEMFNASNHPNSDNTVSAINTATSGQISGAQPARSIQLALKLIF